MNRDAGRILGGIDVAEPDKYPDYLGGALRQGELSFGAARVIRL